MGDSPALQQINVNNDRIGSRDQLNFMAAHSDFFKKSRCEKDERLDQLDAAPDSHRKPRVRTSVGSLHRLIYRSHLAISEKLCPAISGETIRGYARAERGSTRTSADPHVETKM
jgi:hypothetical protein